MKTKFLIPLIAGLGLLCACKGKGSSESADTTSAARNKTATPISNADTVQSGEKLVKTADIHFKVKDVRQTSDYITKLTASNNGTVIHHIIKSTTGDSVDILKSNDSLMRVTVLNTTAEMTIKIPPANMENFMSQVGHLGIYINNSRMDITDKSLDYLATKLKLKNQAALVAAQKKGDANAKSPDDILAFKNNMVDHEIGNSKIDDSVKNSIVTLSFYESNVINKETIANDNLSAYKLPVLRRMGMSIENGWQILVDIFVEAVNLWFLIPFGLGGWMIFKYYKRKKSVDLVKADQI